MSFCSYVFKHIIIIYRCPGPLFDYLTYVDTNSFFFFWQTRDATTLAHNYCQFCCCKMCVCVRACLFLPFCLAFPVSHYANDRPMQTQRKRWWWSGDEYFYVMSCLFYYSLFCSSSRSCSSSSTYNIKIKVRHLHKRNIYAYFCVCIYR